MKPKFTEVINSKQCPAEKLCESFVFEPEEDEQELGSLVAVVAIEGKQAEDEASSWLANIIAYKAKNSFYSREVNDTVEAMQEACLRVNEKLKRLADSEELNWVADLDLALVAFSSEGELILSRIGDISVFLEEDGVFHDLEKELSTSQKSKDYDYLFEEIARGQLTTNGQLAILSSEFSTFFSRDQLPSLLEQVSGLPAPKVREIIKKKGLGCFAALFCKMREEREGLVSFDRSSLSAKVPLKKTLKKAVSAAKFKKRKSSSEKKEFWPAFKKLFLAPFSYLKSLFSGFSRTGSKGLAVKKASVAFLVVVCAGLIFYIGFWSKSPEPSPPEEEPAPIQLPSGTDRTADLSDHPSGFQGKFITWTQKDLWVASSKSVLPVPASTSVDPVFSQTSEVDFEHKLYHPDKNKVFYFSPPDILSVYDLKEGSFTEATLTRLSEQGEVAGIDYYEDNIYLLDVKSKAIEKYTEMNLENPQNWLSEEAASVLDNMISFAIDGSVYILDAELGLGEYRLGSKTDQFELATSSFSSKSQLYTRDGLEYLYLFDPRASEITRLDKSEKIQAGTFSTVDGGLDFSVDSQEENAYVITKNNKIYKTTLKE